MKGASTHSEAKRVGARGWLCLLQHNHVDELKRVAACSCC